MDEGGGESASAGGEVEEGEGEADDEGEASSGFRYRTQRRGGKGLRDIKTTERNGPVIGIVPVKDDDELMMMTARGKIQRVAVSDFNPIGRNTQGVRIITLDEGDTLAAIVRVPQEEKGEGEEGESESVPPAEGVEE
jgi:DNA gyrase subunit A